MARRFRFGLRSLVLIVTICALAAAIWSTRKVDGPPNLSGHITDTRGVPVRGVEVQLYSGVATRWLSQTAVTDGDGRYSLKPLEAGCVIFFNDKDFPVVSVGIQLRHPTLCSVDGKSWFHESVPRIRGHEHVRDFTMTPGGTLTGQILDTASQTPLPGIPVRIMSPLASPAAYVRYTTTDEDGRFRETGLPAGEYGIERNGSPDSQLGEVTIAAGTVVNKTFHVAR